MSILMSSSTLGRDEHGGERGVAAVAGIERRLAHQAMHARLGAQPPIGVLAGELHRGALDARDFARARIDHFGSEAARGAPAQVHAQQHLRPVLGFGAAGAGLDVHEGAVRVHLAVEHALELEAAHLGLEALRVALDVARGGLVVLAFGELEQLGGIGDALGGACRARSTCAARRARSRPSSCARSGFDQMPGSSSSRLTSSRRSFLVSYSKKPPERADALPEVFELALERVQFHGRAILDEQAVVQGPAARDRPAAAGAARPGTR